MSKVLVVDDDTAVLGFLRQLFGDSGFEVTLATDGVAGLREFFLARPDIAVIELKMPYMDGFELCRRIREVSHIPILVLTGLDQINEKVNAFTAGADDYVTKPVSGRELVVRVQACLRRARWPTPDSLPTSYSDAYLTVDYSRREVYVNGVIRELTPIEYALLCLLVQRPGEALSVEYLLTNVWGRDYDTFDLVKWHISNLRKKLQNGGSGGAGIVTVRGFGYRYKKPAEASIPPVS